MIITITGKPCSGKGSICEAFCSKHNFQHISMGSIFRQVALEKGFDDMVAFQNSKHIKDVDNLLDTKVVEMGKTRLNENLVLDSRTAWHFIPKAFKVYVDVDWVEAGRRLIGANREGEHVANLEESVEHLKLRYYGENARYKKIYGIDCTNLKNFDLVINSTNKSAEELADIVYREYQKFIKKK